MQDIMSTRTTQVIQYKFHFGVDGHDAYKVAELRGVLRSYRRKMKVL